ncbi:hypothetical protein ACSNN7_08320 [Micromonospora sp. URMC 105]|uniref:hypothetical protein n=1 Tax=Micromonospora sp. URMC 105 TaxID=3423413 RepID=UPI003F1C144F
MLSPSLPNWTIITSIHTDEPGANIVRHAVDVARNCDSILVIISPLWLRINERSDEQPMGHRSSIPYDAALQVALNSAVSAIPVLIAGARLPDQELVRPNCVEPTHRNAVNLTEVEHPEQTEVEHPEQVARLVQYLQEMRPQEQQLAISKPEGFRLAIDVV